MLMSLGDAGPQSVRWPDEPAEQQLVPWLGDFLRNVQRFRPSARETAEDFIKYGPAQADVALLPEHLALEVLAHAAERPIIGYAAAILVATIPALAPYARGGLLLVILTAICQLLLVLTEVCGSRQGFAVHHTDPILAQVADVRARIGQKIQALPGDALKSGLPALLTRLDQEILPGAPTPGGQESTAGTRATGLSGRARMAAAAECADAARAGKPVPAS